MSTFMGGSAYSFARDIAGGFHSVTERTFRGMGPGELNKLTHEIDRYLRELRGEATAHMDTQQTRERQMRIQRLNGALTVLRAFRQKRRC